MAITYDEAKLLLDELDPDYQQRHWEHAQLRKFYHGKYWEQADSQAHGVASIFRDVASARSDIGPDIKLVRNLIFDVCLKYQSFLSSLPMIRTFIDRPGSRRAQAQADLKERVLYGTWAQGNMNQQLNRGAWYGPLMGDFFLGIWPDFEQNSVTPIVRSPEHAYPVPAYDYSRLDAVLFCWKTTVRKAKRAFPNYRVPTDKTTDEEVEVLEYSDGKEFARWVDMQKVAGVEHDLNFNLFDQVGFINVPGEPWNHGAVEQSVSLVEAGNALYSLMMQAMLENVFPRLILEDPMKFGEDIDTGPGAVIPVNPGGKAYYLNPPGTTLSESVSILQENERAIKQDTSMPDVNFGQFDASIITGKAINALQGAGTGSVVEMVQGAGIGVALEVWNEKALTMYQRLFREDQVYLYGMQPKSMLDLNPRQFAISFKGKEIVGSPRNEVVFSPYIDQHAKLVATLQAQGAGLVSKRHSREQIGISDSEQMQEEIVGEVIEEAVVGAMTQELLAGPSPEAGDTTRANATAYLSGEPVRAPLLPAPPPVTPPGMGGGGPPVAQQAGGGAFMAPALELPPGSPLEGQAGAPALPGGVAPPAPAVPASAGAGISLEEAQQAVANLDLAGEAWFVGQLAAEGYTEAEVEVALTDDTDRQQIADALGVPVVFHRVAGTPGEENVPFGEQPFAEAFAGEEGGLVG